MSLLIAFSGQGSQHAQMFNLLKSCEFGKNWLTQASDILHKDLLDDSIIAQNLYNIIDAQLFIALLSVGAFKLIGASIPNDTLFSGYSLGEASAFCASAQLTLEETCELIQTRAQFMQEAALKSCHNQPAGLAVLKGRLNLNDAQELAETYQCAIAIINDNDHFVLGGLKSQLDELIKAALKKGITKAEKLAVNIPSHTPLLIEASNQFGEYLQKYKNKSLEYAILNALTTEVISTTSDILPILANELSQTIHWNKVMQLAPEYGVSMLLELGPKSALKNMALNKDISKVSALEDFSTIEGFKQNQ